MQYSKEEFTHKLMKFFERHDPAKKFAVPEIVQKFHGHEEVVLDHLSERYAEKEGPHTPKVSGSSYGPSVPGSANAGDTPSGD